MHLWEGVAGILMSVLLYAWASGVHHGPNGPVWARTQLFATLIGVVLVVAVPLAVGVMALGVTEAPMAQVWIALGGVLAGAAAIWAVVPRLVGR